jgi:hypothetical protein
MLTTSTTASGMALVPVQQAELCCLVETLDGRGLQHGGYCSEPRNNMM